MAFEVAWILTALIILATVCIGVFKAILGDGVLLSRGPRDFLLARLARYGDPFTISLMGTTHTVLNSPESIKYVLSTAHESFPQAYPEHIGRFFRPERFAGDRHPHFRKSLLSAASGGGLQKQVPFISSLAEKMVKSWENQAVVNLVDELEKFVFNVAMRIIWRDVEPDSEDMDQMRNEISLIGKGLEALPINFPGFSYHKALKAKQVLLSRIQSEISRRRKAGIQQDDVLNALMSIREVEISDYDLCYMMVSTMFAACETTAALIPWVLKYLDNFPEVRQRVQEEQDGLCQKMIEDKSLTWFKPKSSMLYTLNVIYETMRIEYFIIFSQQANKDIDYNGFVLHKDSWVLASGTSLHFDPKHYPNPREFNPSRFDEKPKPSTFLAFGQGAHYCPGVELALTETMLILHYLIANYRWERCGLERVTKYPFRKFVGFPIHLVKRYMT